MSQRSPAALRPTIRCCAWRWRPRQAKLLPQHLGWPLPQRLWLIATLRWVSPWESWSHFRQKPFEIRQKVSSSRGVVNLTCDTSIFSSPPPSFFFILVWYNNVCCGLPVYPFHLLVQSCPPPVKTISFAISLLSPLPPPRQPTDRRSFVVFPSLIQGDIKACSIANWHADN